MPATLEEVSPVDEIRLRQFMMVIRSARRGFCLTSGPYGEIPERLERLANILVEREMAVLHPGDRRGEIRIWAPERLTDREMAS